MGALAPISGLLAQAGLGGLGNIGGQSTTPPLDNFFGLTPGFLKAPGGGTALFNNILFGSSNQQVPIDFLAKGFYTGVPPIFGGTGFTGLPSRFDLFGGQQGPVGVDAVLSLERLVNGGTIGGDISAPSLGGSSVNQLLGTLLLGSMFDSGSMLGSGNPFGLGSMFGSGNPFGLGNMFGLLALGSLFGMGNSGTSTSAAPAKPAAAAPAKPAATTPAKPAATTPAKPAATTPAKPAATTPAKPAATTPAKPAATTPAKPAATTTTKPVIKAPA